MLYYKPIVRMKFNGNFSNTFTLQRGCRQGCFSSPLLYALYVEPLSQGIKQNKNVKGVHMAGGEQKIALFADDVLIYLSQPGKSLPALMNTMDEFGLLSGHKLNTKKT